MAFIKNIFSAETDRELIQQYRKASDMAALGELYNRYMELIYGVCLKYLADREEAKDAVINIFEELVTKLKKHEIENFRGWLYQLAKNYCLMKIRSDKKYPAYVEADVMQLAENIHRDNEMEKEENLNSMEYCIEQLPGDQKEAIQLFYLKEKCYKEIADTTNTDINKVRSFIQNGRRNLKICMEKQALQKA
ncbi:MAG: sigma-70 family RNA polymerase sigma factor [Ginsengibacter sp.]